MLSPEQQAKIREKDASTPEALKRDPHINYCEGWFFVTLNTRGESPILSTVVGHVGCTGADAPRCEYTELGARVLDNIWAIPQHHPHVHIEAAEVMPEHIHILLYLQPGNRKHLGQTIAGFMGGCTHAYWDQLGIDWHINRFDTNAYASDVPDRDRDHTHSLRGPALFVHGYNDMVPVTEAEVQTRIAYIRDQAKKRLIQGDRHKCFSIRRHQHSRHWSLDVVLRAVTSDPVLSRHAYRMEEEWRDNVLPRLNMDGDNAQAHSAQTPASASALGLDYVGHAALLAAPRRLPLVCHRADIHRFEEQKQAVLAAARSGAVIVSAFISPRERDILKQLLMEQRPVIEIVDNGFPERYKPVGQSFYACGENRLVQISPWTYQYRRKGIEVTRSQCLIMNELARVISDCPDEWWKSGH